MNITEVWENYSPIVVQLSTRADGPLPTSSRLATSPWRQNRAAFFARHGIPPANVVTAGLVHGRHVHVAQPADGGQKIPDTDGLITNTPGVFLAITVADCVPIYFFDPRQNVVGLAHAGWKGMAANIASEMVTMFQERFDADPADIQVGLGPCIQACHFEVGDDVAERFANYPDALDRSSARPHIDLHRVATAQLLAVGVSRSNISRDERCTFEDPQLFSYRRDHDLETGVMTAVIGLRE